MIVEDFDKAQVQLATAREYLKEYTQQNRAVIREYNYWVERVADLEEALDGNNH